jgi:hypothetical protein
MPPRPVSYGKQYFDSDQVMAKVLIETVVKLVEQSAKVKGLNPREILAFIDLELYLMF